MQIVDKLLKRTRNEPKKCKNIPAFNFGANVPRELTNLNFRSLRERARSA